MIKTGGQTGVDRAALDAALACGVDAGGWCPAGRAAEDGPIPARYPLREAPSADPAVRTRLNVRDSDGTLVLAPGPLAGGTRITAAAARAWGRPLRVVDPRDLRAVEPVAAWAEAAGIRALNVAGPRASEWPEGYAAARAFVEALLARLSASRAGART
jgi:hypothetical protein